MVSLMSSVFLLLFVFAKILGKLDQREVRRYWEVRRYCEVETSVGSQGCDGEMNVES